MQAKSKLLRPHDRCFPSLQLIHIPIRPNSVAIQELGLVARSPHHEVCRKVDYKSVSMLEDQCRCQHPLLALTIIVRNPRPSFLSQRLVTHTRLDSARMHTQHKQLRVLVVKILIHLAAANFEAV